MKRVFLVTSTVLAGFAATVSAQKKLQPIDMFRLDFKMQVPAEKPLAWLDATHYAVHDAGEESVPGRGVPKWWKVEAATGKREPLVDDKALQAQLEELLGDDAEIDPVDDADNWTWDAAHQHFVVAIGGDLFASGLDGKAVRLTNTPDKEEVGVSFSPDGKTVAFITDYNLHVVPTAGGEVRALTGGGHDDLFYGRLDWVYQEELYGRGNFQGFWWSPDSKRIALLKLDESPVEEFVLVSDEPARPKIERTNYPKVGEPNPIVEIGAVDVASGETKWFDVSEYPAKDRLVVRVTWAPDSKEVLFQVQNREQTWLDMCAGDPASGKSRKLWRETSDCWVEAGPEPQWLDGGTSFLWLSERDGYKHLYRFARDGKEQGRLTEGDWQVLEVVDVDETSGCVYVLSDKDSLVQAHLYRVPLKGGAMQRLTEGRGTHDVKMAPDHKTYWTEWSSIEVPPCTFLRDVEGKELRKIAESNPAMMETYDLRAPELLQVMTRDGFPMEAMLIKPVDYDANKKYPVLQFTYSGPHTPRVRDRWMGRDYLWHQLVAQRGYVVFCCDNRSASGKGRKFAKACWRQLGQSELSDLEDGVNWLLEKGIADEERVGIWGWSYGGYQTLYNLTHSRHWSLGVAVNPVTDWRLYDTIYTERYGGLPTDNADGYESGSVTAAADNLHGKLMLVAAAMDDNVHMQNSLQFLHALQMHGKDCDFMVYPGVRHGIETLPQQVHLFSRFLKFVEENL
ncbi:MAG: DPP IV N-terminal domain-containing protein [Planctomycetes bacterium]|nr:DPP IV N-terminal domain-containing protein [Planctomycetota bacterium]